MKGGTYHIHEQVIAFLLGSTLEPPEELLEWIATWTVPGEQLMTEQRAAWIFGQQFQDE